MGAKFKAEGHVTNRLIDQALAHLRAKRTAKKGAS